MVRVASSQRISKEEETKGFAFPGKVKRWGKSSEGPEEIKGFASPSVGEGAQCLGSL